MAESATEVIVGGAVLAAALGFVIYAGQVTGYSGEGEAYELRASFRAADGVTAGTDVRLAGVKVGTVTDIELNPETFFADAVISMDARVAIPDDSTALISQEGLLGGNYVEISPGGSLDTYPPGSEILDTQGSVSLITLLLRAFTADDSGEAPPEEGLSEEPPPEEPLP
jgi:phospholipid/cholesterol/gamma-HCH transport system substrate-binding protein